MCPRKAGIFVIQIFDLPKTGQFNANGAEREFPIQMKITAIRPVKFWFAMNIMEYILICNPAR